ncbi:hypothetical protein ATHL_01536 [Anaerolinea thermolimosa]|uniref:DUF4340 domain-containing protein n=1 Tax=Anaerolinea thermolimosa TaxID=229919 RepID=UPI000783C25A|nr:DUF4340 domain-containing protein [Anaerolinea thermolimosa]GAP06680.1 hypothetical protein ATHL_01536 [Anaerolinea thermolimosa]
MIRRSTWIVFIVFLLVAAVGMFLMKSPSSPLAAISAQTPTPTATPRLIEGVTSSQVSEIELLQADSAPEKLVRQADNGWINQKDGNTVDSGTVEQLLSELLATRVLTTLPADYALDALQLEKPQKTILLTLQDGTKIQLAIGGLTPTGNGYYVRVGQNSPSVVSKYAIDSTLTQFDEARKPTPTPTLADTPAPSVTPTP